MAELPKKKKPKKERSYQHKAIEKIRPTTQQFEIPVPREERPGSGKESLGA
jgi:hypothetical protein